MLDGCFEYICCVVVCFGLVDCVSCDGCFVKFGFEIYDLKCIERVDKSGSLVVECVF